MAVIYSPSSLQSAANMIIFWESNASYRLYELVALIVSVTFIFTTIIVHSIKNEAIESMK